MLLTLKIELLRRGLRQSRMAVDLGWDPAKLSRIVNGLHVPTPAERAAIAGYLKLSEVELFRAEGPSVPAAECRVPALC